LVNRIEGTYHFAKKNVEAEKDEKRQTKSQKMLGAYEKAKG